MARQGRPHAQTQALRRIAAWFHGNAFGDQLRLHFFAAGLEFAAIAPLRPLASVGNLQADA